MWPSGISKNENKYVSDDGVDADDDVEGDDDDDSGNAKMIVWTSSYVKEWLGWHQASLVMVRTLNRDDDDDDDNIDNDNDFSFVGTQKMVQKGISLSTFLSIKWQRLKIWPWRSQYLGDIHIAKV